MSNEKVKSLVIEFKAEKQKLLDDLLIGSMIASMTEEEFISIGERAASEIKKCFSELDQTTPKCASSEKTNDASTRTPEAIETTSAQNDTFEEC